MEDALARFVRQRARDICEYCQLPRAYSVLPFEIDHVVARKHRGPTTRGNLALACLYCNSHKGPNIAGIDPATEKTVRLFNPRRHKWSRHFRWNGPTLVGRTSIGRTTIAVLNINDAEAIATREALIDAGVFPPAQGMQG